MNTTEYTVRLIELEVKLKVIKIVYNQYVVMRYKKSFAREGQEQQENRLRTLFEMLRLEGEVMRLKSEWEAYDGKQI